MPTVQEFIQKTITNATVDKVDKAMKSVIRALTQFAQVTGYDWDGTTRDAEIEALLRAIADRTSPTVQASKILVPDVFWTSARARAIEELREEFRAIGGIDISGAIVDQQT